MTNAFYENDPLLNFVSGETAMGADVDAKFDLVEAGFDKLPTESQLKEGTAAFADVTGTNNLAITLPYPWTTFVGRDGSVIVIRTAAANTGAVTLNPDTLGAKSVVRLDGTALQADDFAADAFYSCRYHEVNNKFYAMATEGMLVDIEAARVNALADVEIARVAAVSDANDEVTYATEWAEKAEDSAVSVAAGGDASTTFSSLHHAAKSAVSATTAETYKDSAIVAAAAASAAAGLPSLAGNAGQALIVSPGETGVEWGASSELILHANTVGKKPITGETGDFTTMKTYMTSTNLPVDNNYGFYCVNDVYFALKLGTGGITTIYTSSDKITWTTRNTATAAQWTGVVWTGAKYVVNSQSYATSANSSTDLVTWAAKTTVATGGNAIGFASDGAGTIVRINGSGAASEFSANNGDTWSLCTSDPITSGPVHWVGSNFISLDASGTIWTSADGNTWASYDLNAEIGCGNAVKLQISADGKLYVRGVVGSTIGLQWITSATGLAGSWSVLGYGPTMSVSELHGFNGVYIMFQWLQTDTVMGVGAAIYTSTDFVTWVRRTLGQTPVLNQSGQYSGMVTFNSSGVFTLARSELIDGGATEDVIGVMDINPLVEGIFK